MFDDIPENYSSQTADNEEEGWRYTQGDKNARRPPELLTRDHVARCIMREVREGRGSPHGGVFLDIAWIKEQAPERRRSTSRRSCRACTTSSRSWPTSTSRRSRWRSARPRTTSWAACASTPTRRCRRCRACSPRASAPPASTAPTASAATRSRTCSCSASAPASTRRSSRKRARRGARRRRPGRRGGACGARAVRARRRRREPVSRSSTTCRSMMQDLVGIVRTRGARWSSALDGIGELRERAAQRRRDGQPRVQPGLAHGARPAQPADGLRGDHARGARAQGEPRRPLPRRLSRARTPSCGEVQHRRAQGRRTARCSSTREPIPEMPAELQADHRGDRSEGDASMREPRRSAIWRGDANGGRVRGLHDRRSPRAWSCSTPSTRSRPSRPTTSPCAGTARPASAARARPRSTASRGSCA